MVTLHQQREDYFQEDQGICIIHGLFVDDIMKISSCDELEKKFMNKDSKRLRNHRWRPLEDIPGNGSGTERQDNYLDCYIQQVLAEYEDYIKKPEMLRPKKVPI
jgi:hypothetical protein